MNDMQPTNWEGDTVCVAGLLAQVRPLPEMQKYSEYPE